MNILYAALLYLMTSQAHPLACAASLAVQKVIAEENLLENARKIGAYLSSLLREKLLSPNCLAAPYIFDIRGAGCWWGIEFDFDGPQCRKVDRKSWKPLDLVVRTHAIHVVGVLAHEESRPDRWCGVNAAPGSERCE